jgi:cell surface protein SprA
VAQINGTEGSKDDPDRLGRFDTEDINNNTNLEKQNGYFQYTVHLNNPQYQVDSTSRGWKLLRIPLQDSTIYSIRGTRDLADFTRINFARLWLTGTPQPYHLAIATIELVGNKWRELEIAVPEGDVLRPNEKFEIAVKNTHDNANYYPPPGIEGNLNRETNIREKEQSLVLNYQNMPALHLGGAAWTMYNSESYTQYNRLKMYVHGDTADSSGVLDDRVTFFFSLNTDNNNFYEYRTVLDTGWSQSNWVEIEFDKFTDLKYRLQQSDRPDSLPPDTTSGHYRVFGNPSLSQIKWFIVGVEIAGDAPDQYSGEVWIDEMRVVDVRRNSDFAGRIQAVARFSDFFDVTVGYSRTGADFYSLSAKAPVGSTTIGKSARFNISTHKLLPPSLGLSMPVSISLQSTLALPRLKPGSDIILGRTDQEREKDHSKSYSYTVNESFSRNTKNWLWNLTLNRIKTNYTFTHADRMSPVNPIERRHTYRGSAVYDLSPKAKFSFSPFSWTKYLFLPKSVQGSKLSPLPTQLSFSGEVNGSKSVTVNQRGIITSTRVRDLLLSGNTALSIFPSLRTNYSVSSSRDISRPGRFKLSIDPSKLKLGQERTFQQRFETSYQPKFVNFLENRFTFNSSYNENADLTRNVDSTRTTQMTSAVKADLTLNLLNLFSPRGRGNRPPPTKPSDTPKPPGEDEAPGMREQQIEEQTKQDDHEKGGAGAGSSNWMLRQFASLFKSVKPVRGSYMKDKKFGVQGLIDRPSWDYMFGLAENPHARRKATSGLGSANQIVFSDNYQLESGLQPGRGLDIGASYSLRKTNTRTTTNPVFTRSTTFPDISATLSQLEKLFLFSKIASSVSLQSNYSKKVDENGDAGSGETYKRDTSKDWTPLAALNVNFKNNVRATVRYDLGRTFQDNLRSQGQSNRDTEISRNTIKVSFQYSLTAPKGLKLPLLKRIKFNSQLSLNFDITLNNSKTQSISGGVKSVDGNKSQMTIEPRMSYQFSRAITGSIRARWDDSNDKILKRKHHIRELGISAEIKF